MMIGLELLKFFFLINAYFWICWIIYVDLYPLVTCPACLMSEKCQKMQTLRVTKKFLSQSSCQVKCVVTRIFISQTHGDEIFYQIFIKPTKMPNKTWTIINNNISRLFAKQGRAGLSARPRRSAQVVQNIRSHLTFYFNYFTRFFLKPQFSFYMDRFFLKTGICDRNMFMVKNDFSWHLNFGKTLMMNNSKYLWTVSCSLCCCRLCIY